MPRTDSEGPPPPAARLGWVGTGRMGFEMARRLAEQGHPLAAWNRTRARAEPLAASGAEVAGTLAELTGRDIVFVMVARPENLIAVTTGPGGLLRQRQAPRVLVDLSTVSMEVSAEVRAAAAEVGTRFLAAAVSGSPKVVRAGRLSIVASGPRETFEEVRPYLEQIGQVAVYAGEGELARLVKLSLNLYLGAVIASLIEATVLAERGGVSRAAFLEFTNGSAMGSIFTRYKAPALVNLDFAPLFTMTMLEKDLGLGLAEAHRRAVPMPVTTLVHELVQAAIGHGHGDQDFAALLELQARAAGMALTSEDVDLGDGL
ncbi:MAG: NAD(P)-dependent oxidoreductase [Candidatus Dormibacteraceae bacterium]